MKFFLTGASGYIGGSVAQRLIGLGHDVSGLVRSEQKAQQIQQLGIQPVIGTLADAAVLAAAANLAGSASAAAAQFCAWSTVDTALEIYHSSRRRDRQLPGRRPQGTLVMTFQTGVARGSLEPCVLHAKQRQGHTDHWTVRVRGRL